MRLFMLLIIMALVCAGFWAVFGPVIGVLAIVASIATVGWLVYKDSRAQKDAERKAIRKIEECR
jgi:hypothetical protein